MNGHGVVIGEFAVNPACVQTLGDVRDMLRVFGFQNGAVIAEFPRSWIADVKSLAQQIEEPARKAFLEKVDRLKEKAMVRVGRTAEGPSWLERALKSHEERPFDAILHTEPRDPCLCFTDALADDRFPPGVREAKVLRNAESMVRAILPLVQSSERFSLIDPYFSPDEYHAKFVRQFVNRNREIRNKLLYIDIHREHDRNRLGDFDPSQVIDFQKWATGLPTNLIITVRWWDDCETGEIHPRYLITERGGVRFDRGFIVPSLMLQQNSDADVTMMTEHMIKTVEDRYSETYRPLECVQKQEYRT